MSSKIEQLIDELEEYIENCKPKFMSNSEIIVNKDEIDELLRELRMKTPDEIKRYQKIISNKEAILGDARTKAQTLINEATSQAKTLVDEAAAQTNALLSEHAVMQQAHAQADEVITLAVRQAQEILDKATMEANELRMQAAQYTEDRLAELEAIIVSSIQASSANYETLLGSLVQYRDVVQANRRAFHPVEEDLEEIPLEEDPEGQNPRNM